MSPPVTPAGERPPYASLPEVVRDWCAYAIGLCERPDPGAVVRAGYGHTKSAGGGEVCVRGDATPPDGWKYSHETVRSEHAARAAQPAPPPPFTLAEVPTPLLAAALDFVATGDVPPLRPEECGDCALYVDDRDGTRKGGLVVVFERGRGRDRARLVEAPDAVRAELRRRLGAQAAPAVAPTGAPLALDDLPPNVAAHAVQYARRAADMPPFDKDEWRDWALLADLFEGYEGTLRVEHKPTGRLLTLSFPEVLAWWSLQPTPASAAPAVAPTAAAEPSYPPRVAIGHVPADLLAFALWRATASRDELAKGSGPPVADAVFEAGWGWSCWDERPGERLVSIRRGDARSEFAAPALRAELGRRAERRPDGATINVAVSGEMYRNEDAKRAVFDAIEHAARAGMRRQTTAPSAGKATETMTKATVVETLKADATDAAVRSSARQAVRLAQAPLAALLERHVPEESTRAALAAFLRTELGTAVIGLALSGVLSAVPNAPPVARTIARELRVAALANGADVLLDAVTGPALALLSQLIADNPALVAVAPAALDDGQRAPQAARAAVGEVAR